MSSNLMWKPVVYEGTALPFELKRPLSMHLWETDGSCGHGEAELTRNDIPVLTGMMLTGSYVVRREIKVLIDAINKHGAIVLWHEH